MNVKLEALKEGYTKTGFQFLRTFFSLRFCRKFSIKTKDRIRNTTATLIFSGFFLIFFQFYYVTNVIQYQVENFYLAVSYLM